MMMKLGCMLLLVTVVVAQQSSVWYRYQPLLNDATFTSQLFQCVNHDATCNADQEDMRNVLVSDTCQSCSNCCSLRIQMVAAIKQKFRGIKSDYKLEDMIEC